MLQSRYVCWFIGVFFSGWMGSAWGAAGVTYHGRLLRPNGQPVVSSSVQFRIQIRTTLPSNCLMYEEVQTKDLSDSGGVFSLTVNDGSATAVNTEPFTLDQVFRNHGTLSFGAGKCSGTGSVILNPTDSRQLQVSFNDGSFAGWEPLPSQQINFTPTALEAVSVGGFRGDQLFRVVDGGDIPQDLDPWPLTNYTKLLDLVDSVSVSGGTTSITGTSSGFTGTLSGDVTGAQSATSVVRLQGRDIVNAAPSSGDVLKWNGSAWSPGLDDNGGGGTPSGPAGGDLSGTYPNPAIANNAVTSSKIASNAVGTSHLANGSVAGQAFRYDGSAWQIAKLRYTDLMNVSAGSPWPVTSCSAGEFIIWQSATDSFVCSALSSGMVTGALGYTPVSSADLSNYARINGNSVTSTMEVGTNSAHGLALKTNGTTRMTIDTAGNVGIGVTNPTKLLQVERSTDNQEAILVSNPNDGGNARAAVQVSSGTTNVSSGYISAYHNAYTAVPLFQDRVVLGADSSASKGVLIQSASAGQSIEFNTNGNTNTELTIASNGNVGIGTTSPDYKVHIKSDLAGGDGLKIEGSSGSASAPVVRLTNGATPTVSLGSAMTAGHFMGGSSVGDGLLYTHSANNLIFGTNAAERVRIDANGNVGIGTPAPLMNKLHVVDASVNSTGALAIRGDLSGTVTVNGTYYNKGVYGYINKKIDGGVTDSGYSVALHGAALRNSLTTADNGSLNSQYGAWIQYGHYNSDAGATPTTTNAYGIYLHPYQSTGTIANMYDLFIATPATGGTVTNRWAIYQHHASSRNYFAGNVGIGIVNPTTKLEVNGTVKAMAFEGLMSSSVVGAGAGTNSAPSMSFSGDTDTGFYNASSNDTISVTAGGTNIFNFTSNGLTSPTAGGALVKTGNGDASAPTFSFSGDPDTGWFRPAADTLAASAGGSEKVRISSAGNVGIGTTNPAGLLHLSTTTPVVRIQDTDDTNGSNSRAGYISFRDSAGTEYGWMGDGSNSTNRMGIHSITETQLSTPGGSLLLDALGNVGIGMTTPDAPLVVARGSSDLIARFGSMTANSGAYLRLQGKDVTNTAFQYWDLRNNADGSFSINGNASTLAERLRIDSAGNIGIGTASPNAAGANATARVLSIAGDGTTLASNGRLELVNPKAGGSLAAGDNAGQIMWSVPNNGGGGSNVMIGAMDAALHGVGGPNGFGGQLQFRTKTDNTSAQPIRMVIDSSGNVGIGTTSPGSPLEVNGLVGINGGNSTGIWMWKEDKSARNWFIGQHGSVTNDNFLLTKDGRTDFSILDSNGNVGIGTPTPTQPLDVVGAGRFTGVLSSMNFSVYSSGGVPLAANMYAPVSNTLAFGTNDLERVRIDASGNVGIGKTNPSYKIDVSGDVNASGCVRAGGSTLGGTCASDARLKTEVRSFDLGLKELLGLRPRTFKYNGLGGHPASDGSELGVIAQEVERTAPQLVVIKEVKMNPDDRRTTEIKQVNYTAFTYVLINAVRDLYRLWFDDSQALHRELASTQAENARLRQENEHIKTWICAKDPQAGFCRR